MSDNVSTSYQQICRQFPRLFRAHVEPKRACDPERTVFVEAVRRDEARQKIRTAIAAIDECEAAAVEFYNLDDIRELLDGHFSEDCALRIFETGSGCHNGRSYETYCKDPLILTKNPRALLDIWMRCPRRSDIDEDASEAAPGPAGRESREIAIANEGSSTSTPRTRGKG